MSCVKGMPTRRNNQPGSGCHGGCLHRAMVLEWREAWYAWQRRREDWSHGYNGENREYATVTGDHPPLFRDWLVTRWASGREVAA